MGPLRDSRPGYAEQMVDILLALPPVLMVANVSVIHPAAQSYANAAAAAAGSGHGAAVRDQ